MSKLTKKQKILVEKVDPEKTYSVSEALEIMQSVKAANVVAGNDPECSEWIANYREPGTKSKRTRRRSKR